MNKSIFVVLIFGVFMVGAWGVDVYRLPEVNNPSSITADSQNIYIMEKTSVYIYSQTGFKLVKKFGQPGEGPSEFKGYARVIGLPQGILVNSFDKISYFTRGGDFIKEIRSPYPFIRQFYPVGNKFVAVANFMAEYKVVNLYDSQLGLEKEIYRSTCRHKPGEILKGRLKLVVSGERIYIAPNDEFLIYVFDRACNQIDTFEIDYPRIRFTHKDKRDFLESYRTEPVTRDFYENFKKNAVFPAYFPAIDQIFVANALVYVQTFKKEAGHTEFIILSPAGKVIKSVFLPIEDSGFMSPAVFTIYDGTLFQLIENERDESWELHLHKFDPECLNMSAVD